MPIRKLPKEINKTLNTTSKIIGVATIGLSMVTLNPAVLILGVGEYLVGGKIKFKKKR